MLQNIGTRMENARAVSLANSTGTTCLEVYSIETDADAVRFLFFNNQTTGTYTIGPVKVAAVADISIDQNQNGATWTNVTFGGATTYVAPNATDTNDPVPFFSDWINLNSVARVNDSSGLNCPIYIVRTYFPSTTANYTSSTPSINHPPSGHQMADGRVYLQRRMTGVDGVTTPANMTSTTNIGNGATFGIQYAARNKVLQIYAVGDSITASANGNDPVYGWLPRLKNLLSTKNIPVEIANLGWATHTTTQYATRAIRILPQLPNGLVIYSAYSPNDNGTLTQTVINTMLSNMAASMRTVYAAGHYPVVWTPLPAVTLVTTSSAAAAATPGLNTITPASMDSIINGRIIMLDQGGKQEFVTASNVTGTTFDCTTINSHSAGFTINVHADAASSKGTSDSFRIALTATLKSYSGMDIIDMSPLGNGANPEFWADTYDHYDGLNPADGGAIKMAKIAYNKIMNILYKFI